MSDNHKLLLCCMTPMEYQAGDCDDNGSFEEWMECKHCGHTKTFDVIEKTKKELP